MLTTMAQHTTLKRVLFYDKDKNSIGQGRVLRCNLPAPYNLLEGDRLEPSLQLADIGEQFDQLTVEKLPIELTLDFPTMMKYQ